MDPSTSAVHRVFALDEILTMILRSVVSLRSRTLASLARTCKRLNMASIPLLWETLYSLLPLLRLLPDALTEGRDENDRIIFVSPYDQPLQSTPRLTVDILYSSSPDMTISTGSGSIITHAMYSISIGPSLSTSLPTP